jgi:hypothetical protein
MWPLNLIRQRRYRRQFDAAVATLLGEATYERLGATDRARVDAEVFRSLRSSFTPGTAMDLFAMHWQVKAQCRARVMARLGIQPLGRALTWRQFIPRMLILPEANLLNRFSLNSSATVDAEEFLREHGVNVQAVRERKGSPSGAYAIR